MFQCRALYPYQPTEADELALNEGDVLDVFDASGNDEEKRKKTRRRRRRRRRNEMKSKQEERG